MEEKEDPVEEGQRGQRNANSVLSLTPKEVTAPSGRYAQFCQMWQRAK